LRWLETSTNKLVADHQITRLPDARLPSYPITTFTRFVIDTADAILTTFSSMTHPASDRIEEGVIDVLKNVSRRPIEPTLSSDLVADLGFDSLQVLEAIAELEDRFDISIPLNDVPATRTVAHVVSHVAALIDGRSGA
jgi:acyl carrier protein